jgi:hypothetical protein
MSSRANWSGEVSSRERDASLSVGSGSIPRSLFRRLPAEQFDTPPRSPVPKVLAGTCRAASISLFCRSSVIAAGPYALGGSPDQTLFPEPADFSRSVPISESVRATRLVNLMVEFGVGLLVLLSAGIFLAHAIDAYHAQ